MAQIIAVLMTIILTVLAGTNSQSGAIVTRARLLFTHAMPSVTEDLMKNRNHWPQFLGRTFKADLVNNYQLSEEQIQQVRLRQQLIKPDQNLQILGQPQLQQQTQQEQQQDIQPNPFLLKEIKLNKNNLQSLVDTNRALSQQVQPIQSSLNLNLQHNAQNIQHEQNDLILDQPQNTQITPEIQKLFSPQQHPIVNLDQNQGNVFSNLRQLESHIEQQSSFNEDPVIKQLSSEIKLLDQQLLELSQQSPQAIQGLHQISDSFGQQAEQITPFVPEQNIDQFQNINTQSHQQSNQLFDQQQNLDQFQNPNIQISQQSSQLFDQQPNLNQIQKLNTQSDQQSSQLFDQQPNLNQIRNLNIQSNPQSNQLFDQRQNIDPFQNLNIQAVQQSSQLADQQQNINQFQNLNSQLNQQVGQLFDHQKILDQFQNLNSQAQQQSSQLFDQQQNLDQLQNTNIQTDQQSSQLFDQQPNQIFDQQQTIDQFQNLNIQSDQQSNQFDDQQKDINQLQNSQLFNQQNLNSQALQHSSASFDQQLSPTPVTSDFDINVQQFSSNFKSTSSSLNQQPHQQFNRQFDQPSPKLTQHFTLSGGFNPQHISQDGSPILDVNNQQQQIDISSKQLNLNQQQFQPELNNQFNKISKQVPQPSPSNEIQPLQILPQTEQLDQQQFLQLRTAKEEAQSQQLQLQQPDQHANDSRCRRPCQKILDVVCGSDGVSYTNPCELGSSSCSNKDLVQLHKGLCGTVPATQRRRGKSLASAPAKGNEVPPGVLAVFAAAGPRLHKGIQ